MTHSSAPVPVWRLTAWNVAPRQAGLMVRLRMIPASGNPTTYWGEFPQTKKGRDQLAQAIEYLKAAGLHGVARKARRRSGRRPSIKPVSIVPSGFGARLNARPIAGSWRRKTKRK